MSAAKFIVNATAAAVTPSAGIANRRPPGGDWNGPVLIPVAHIYDPAIVRRDGVHYLEPAKAVNEAALEAQRALNLAMGKTPSLMKKGIDGLNDFVNHLIKIDGHLRKAAPLIAYATANLPIWNQGYDPAKNYGGPAEVAVRQLREAVENAKEAHRIHAEQTAILRQTEQHRIGYARTTAERLTEAADATSWNTWVNRWERYIQNVGDVTRDTFKAVVGETAEAAADALKKASPWPEIITLAITGTVAVGLIAWAVTRK